MGKYVPCEILLPHSATIYGEFEQIILQHREIDFTVQLKMKQRGKYHIDRWLIDNLQTDFLWLKKSLQR